MECSLQAPLSSTISPSLSIRSMMLCNHLILCRLLLLLPSVFPASGSFPVSLCIRWSKYWSFNFSRSPSNEYSGLISFRIDWFNLIVVQGTLKSLLAPQLESIYLQYSAFFMDQLLYSCMTTGKTTAAMKLKDAYS